MALPIATGKNKYRILLTNRNPYPYALYFDSICSEVDVLTNKSFSYLSNLPVELWLNWNGDWKQYDTGVTSTRGTCILRTSSNAALSPITNCLGISVVTINNKIYLSNTIRYNFYEGGLKSEFRIDANKQDKDRSLFDIFNGYGRSNTFDRMI